jgi:sec-independent protein translocase protein TatA
MGTFSIWHWLVVLAVVLILFGGGGKISRLMGDFGKGLKSFKKSMKEDEGDGAEAPPAAGDSSTTASAAKPALKTEQVQNAQGEPKKDKAAQG